MKSTSLQRAERRVERAAEALTAARRTERDIRRGTAKKVARLRALAHTQAEIAESLGISVYAVQGLERLANEIEREEAFIAKAKKDPSTRVDEGWPFGVRAEYALRTAGFETVAELLESGARARLRQTKNVGRATVDELDQIVVVISGRGLR